MMQSKNGLLREQILRVSGVNPRKCMQCGKCTATCPSFDEMEYHPHEFVRMVESGEIEPLMKSESIYKCLTCFGCVERCPRSVEPAKLIEAVRNAVLREKGGSRLTPDAVPPMLDGEMPQQLLMAAFRKYSK